MKNSNLYRTDLALEAADTGDGALPDGVFVRENEIDGVTVTTVRIDTTDAAQRLCRSTGEYITIEGDMSLSGEKMTDILTKNLSRILPNGNALIIGLGNRAITPDTIGVLSAESVMATRHLPKEEMRAIGLDGLRDVCVLTPGVMGQTGLEVLEIAGALVKTTPFDFAVVIDSLAARSMTRLGRTIQLSDSGISPGSGVLNNRAEISRLTLGLPVFSLGIPTVVDAAVIAGELYDDNIISQRMVVTPRTIDKIAEQGSAIISRALNRALQPSLSAEDIDLLLS